MRVSQDGKVPLSGKCMSSVLPLSGHFAPQRTSRDFLTQPVPPCHPRRGRGPPQGQSSVEPHEAKPFQMRDMYMSLIDARMQSIHRGQVATVEIIIGMYDTPPRHRWTMDEFNNMVAWPEDRAQASGVGAAEASALGDEDDDDAFEDVEDDEDEEDSDDSMG
ncbi:hypothetical protein LR48_Vigan08g071400 [Vigna angularis]|uniref:Uncharacterized protein n=1 Tax=Phaseolus angularis TaxID=3914 RepID=A0A0L9V4K3_PHAAN|nr:hypothetical protein LR48_Vigan08g071400 [Vigna angularis]